jgi:hypothetical protein
MHALHAWGSAVECSFTTAHQGPAMMYALLQT